MVSVKVKSRSSKVKSFEATFKGQLDSVSLAQLKQQIQSTAKACLLPSPFGPRLTTGPALVGQAEDHDGGQEGARR